MYRLAVPSSPVTSPATVFRLPRSAYLIVLVLLFGTVPLAFAGSDSSAEFGPRAVLMVIPVLAAVFVARSATIVDATGIRVRALFGSRQLSWTQIRGLSVQRRSVYAVCADGAVRLPNVRTASLAWVARASAGHLPEIADAPLKSAPTRRRR